MKGIVISLKELEKVPNWIKDRLIVTFSGKDKFHLISPDNDETLIGEAVCAITGEKKIPIYTDTDSIIWKYPKWKGETLGDYEVIKNE